MWGLRAMGGDRDISFDQRRGGTDTHGFLAECPTPLPEGTTGRLTVDLGAHETATVEARAVRCHTSQGVTYHGFQVPAPDAAWQRCVDALQSGRTHRDLLPEAPSAEAASVDLPLDLSPAVPPSLPPARPVHAVPAASASAREELLSAA